MVLELVILLFIVVGIIAIIVQGGKIHKSIKNNESYGSSISQILINTGIITMGSAYIGGFDRLLLLVSIILERKDLETVASFNLTVFISGLAMIALGVIAGYVDKNYICVLNINAYSKTTIGKEKINIGFRNIKEEEVDIINTYRKRFKPNYNEQYMKDILEDIENHMSKFKYESKGKKTGYTGIAPIPIVMYAGSCIDRMRIDEFIEFDNKNTKEYYKLSNEKKTYPKMNILTDFNSLNKQNTEVILIVSVTREIKDSQLIQFGDIDKVHLSIKKTGDNSIKSKKQLKEYTRLITDTAEELGRIMPNLKTIHLVCSVQSCLALELGRMYPEGTRNSEIICYQFECREEIKYPWGIVINGDNRGVFIKGGDVR